MKRICPACGVVLANTAQTCPKCGWRTTSIGRAIIKKGEGYTNAKPEEGAEQ